MTAPYVVTLTEEELTLGANIAAERDGAKKRAGIERSGTYEAGYGDTLTLHTMTALAEVAVAKATGGTVDRTVSTRGSRAGNVILPDGTRANVKYRNQRGYDYALKSDSMDGFYGEIGFLVWPAESGTRSQVEIVGWMMKHYFEHISHVEEFKAGRPVLVLSYQQMWPLSEAPDAWRPPDARPDPSRCPCCAGELWNCPCHFSREGTRCTEHGKLLVQPPIRGAVNVRFKPPY